MASARYADLAFKPVELTAQEVLDNLPAEAKADYQPAPLQTVMRDQPILLFHKPANDNEKQEELETQPDEAEKVERKLARHLSPRLQQQVEANRTKKQRPHRAKLKTEHSPKPSQPVVKPFSSEPLNDIIRYYQELQPETEILPFKPHAAKKHRGELKLFHTAESLLEEMPKLQKHSTALRRLIHATELLSAIA